VGILSFFLVSPNLVLAQPSVDLPAIAQREEISAKEMAAEAALIAQEEAAYAASIAKQTAEQAAVEAKRVAKEAAHDARVMAGVNFLVNSLTFFADKMAYEAAQRIITSGNGGTSLIEQRAWDGYWNDVAFASAGNAIGLLRDDIQSASPMFRNFNLCKPSDAKVTLAFQIGIQGIFKKPIPKCEIKDVVKNWKGFIADISTQVSGGSARNQHILMKLADAMDPSTSEFSVGITLTSNIISKAQKDADQAEKKRLADGGVKDVTDFITGQIKTPSQMVTNQFNLKMKGPGEVRDGLGIALMSNTKVLPQIALFAGSIFANTLLSNLSTQMFTGLFNVDPGVNPFDPADFGQQTSSLASLKSILTVAPIEISNYSILSDFGACPSSDRGIFNCVADSSLISAVARASSGVPVTVKEAMEQGLLKPDWPLIPSSDNARNQDPFCYTYGYCYANLVKLRKSRVLSVGWEFAADSIYNSQNNPTTLRKVVEGFGSCDASGKADQDHPWCKLIDPNWVLKYPQTQCRAAVNGQLLASNSSAERQTECVDMPSCISEDENGNCTGGYGYCVKEENVWQFRGQSCPAQFASCITVKNSEKTVSYLRNTTDPGPCTADNAGCQWYATQKTKQTDGSYIFPATNVLADDVAADTYKNRTYFTSEVEVCQAENGGCKELVVRDASLSLNMLVNPSFESDIDNNGKPDGWTFMAPTGSIWDAGSSRSGSKAIKSGGGVIREPGIEFSQGRFYTMSFYARQTADGGIDTGEMSISLSADDNSQINLTGLSMVAGANSTCVFVDGNADGKTDSIDVRGKPAGTIYERFSCTFTSPIQANSAARIFGTVDFPAQNTWVDDVQVEQGPKVTPYHSGYSSTTPAKEVVKVPPSYLGCTGASTDPAECAKYAKVCSENDNGCSAFTPANGDPVVTGVVDIGLPLPIVDGQDECSAVCVGYDTYRQEGFDIAKNSGSRFEPDGVFPLYLIPSTAKTCRAQDVGCDEFTNLSDESKSYFTYVRACVTPAQAEANTGSDNSATFYTWEGSDNSGYQLKTWDLLQSNLGLSTYTYQTSLGIDTAPGNAPCENGVATPNGMTCADAVDSNGDQKYDWDTASCDAHSDIFSNSDCREFYDANGVIHYRLWSNTVSVDNACATYRKTTVAGADEAARTTTCTNSGGFFDPSAGTCRYYGLATGSKTCSAAANGCRSYTGGRSRNSFVAYQDLIEDGSLTKFASAVPASLVYSNESLATGGHSISTNAPFATLASSLKDKLPAGRTFTLSFLAKGTGTIQAGFDYQAAAGSPTIDLAFGSATVSQGWQQYSLGPLDMSNVSSMFGEGTALAFVPAGNVFVDNIVLRAGQDNITLIKNSWSTPAVCDMTPTGTQAPQYYLGCQAYSTQDAKTVNVKSFSKLCSQDKVGCASFFMTQESTSPHAEVHNATCGTIGGAIATSATSCFYGTSANAYDTTTPMLCTIGVGSNSCPFNLNWYVSPSTLPAHIKYAPSTVITPADKDVFLVVTDDKKCASDAAGCTEYGKPTYNQARTSTTGATSKYFKNDPSAYVASGTKKATLCTQNALYCSAWTGTGGTQYYFRDPIDQTCEYKTNVNVGTVSYSGWFKTGTSEPCYTDSSNIPSYVVGGNMSGIWKNGDAKYGGWVGACTTQYNSCSEYQDPLAVASNEIYGNADGTPYFSLTSSLSSGRSNVTGTDCNNKVSLKAGCALFNDTATSKKNANASATEISSRHADVLFNVEPFSLVAPIDCDSNATLITPRTGPAVDLCNRRCVYSEDKVKDLTARTSTLKMYGSSCYVASDCAPVTSEAGETVTASGCSDAVGVPRLKDDTNTVLAVNRNRQCSEWLSCSDAQTVWDERSNSYKTVCGAINLCTEYSAQGSSSFCSKWNFEDPKTVLDNDKYTSRDVTWYGDEYSGMSIPNLFPVETLSQENVEPPLNKCNLVGSAAPTAQQNFFNGRSCTSDNNCWTAANATTHGDILVPGSCPLEAKPDYRLVLNAGKCSGDYGDSCTVGACENTGAVCATSDDCGNSGGACVVGQCYVPRVTVKRCSNQADCAVSEVCKNVGGEKFCANSCLSDSNCLAGNICSGGVCNSKGNIVVAVAGTPPSTMPAGQSAYVSTASNKGCDLDTVFTPSVSRKDGTCINSQCLLSPGGATFALGTSETKSCKAYPEVASPFSSEVVDSWLDTKTGEKLPTGEKPTIDDLPYNIRSGFEKASFCAYGEDCVCSYKKVVYGGDQASTYYSKSYTADVKGVCSGGKNKGSLCTGDYECASDDQSFNPATCLKASSESVFLGMDGYCLERDTSININGDRNQNACINWLPVDQLSGSSDLYGTSTEAGFNQEANYCSKLAVYADLGVASACAERNNLLGNDLETTSSVAAKTSCIGYGKGVTTDDKGNTLFTCPPGTYAIVGPMKDAEVADGAWAGTMAGTSATYCSKESSGDNDCPYLCVPLGAVDMNGKSCDVDRLTLSNNETLGAPILKDRGSYTFNAYWLDTFDAYESAVTAVSSCVAYGREVKPVTGVVFDKGKDNAVITWNPAIPAGIVSTIGLGNTDNFSDNDDNTPYEFMRGCRSGGAGTSGDNCGWRKYKAHFRTYLACSEYAQLQNPAMAGAPKTDVLLNSSARYTIQVPPASKYAYAYTQQSKPGPFGMAENRSQILTKNNGRPSPSVIAQCQNNTEADEQDGTNKTTFIPPNISSDGSFSCPTNYLPNAKSPDLNNPEARSYLDFSNQTEHFGLSRIVTGSVGDPPVSLYGYEWSVSLSGLRSLDQQSIGVATSVFKQLFASSLQKFSFINNLVSGVGTVSPVTASTSIVESWDSRSTEGHPPKIWAINSATCKGSECEEGPANSITVNDQNTGTISSSEFLRASVKFYAAADKNQLPLRRVIVDWEGNANPDALSGSSSEDNFYKNHRGLKPGTTTSLCDTGTEWGMTPESCDPNYLTYSHIYTCPTSLQLSAPTCIDANSDGRMDVTPCIQGTGAQKACVYQPRVHTRDNWGWCSGVCTMSAEDSLAGCYAGNAYGLGDTEKSQSECAYLRYPKYNSAVDPWVYYNGQVIVTP